MPHVVIEYSANLEAFVDPMRLVDAVFGAVTALPIFDPPGIRVRAARCDDYRIADGDPEHAFVAVTGRIGPGRSQEARKAASEAIMAALFDAVEPIYQSRRLLLSVEVTEFDGAGMTRRNSLRER